MVFNKRHVCVFSIQGRFLHRHGRFQGLHWGFACDGEKPEVPTNIIPSGKLT